MTTSHQNSSIELLTNQLLDVTSNEFDESDQLRVRAAREIAERAHRDQTRSHGAPYLLHPLRVSLILWNEYGERDASTLCAALLHDVLEDAPEVVSASAIETSCGADVLHLVETLTAPRAADKGEQSRLKAEKVVQGPASTRYIKLADRTDNLRDSLAAPGSEGRRFRRRYYADTLMNYAPMARDLGDQRVLERFEHALKELKEAIMTDTSTPRFVHADRIELDVGRMRLPDNLEQRYGPLFDAAVHKMKRLEAGEYVNRDENSQVGHYWLRNWAAAPAPQGEHIARALETIDVFCTETFTGRFDRVLWIGIGGSALGPQMLYAALRVPGETSPMLFFDNTDPDGMKHVLQEIAGAESLRRTLTVVVSKSGGTKETQNGMLVAQHAYAKAGIPFEKCFVAITKPGSKLDKLAGPEDPQDPETSGPKWLARFPIWDFVGGRTSLFSAVGRLPAKLLDLGGAALCNGARAVDAKGLNRSLCDNAALLLAASWFHAVETLGLRNMVVLPYCDRLQLLSKYLQQLVMESLGKDGKGMTVYGNKGSTDQHSYAQQLRDGYPDFFVTFINVLKPDADWTVAPTFSDVVSPEAPSSQITVGDYLAAFLEGTSEALSEAGRLSLRITVDELNAFTLGGLVALFERAVGYYAGMLGINAYHQPGVEAGKRAATTLLALQTRLIDELRKKPGGRLAVSQLANETDASDDQVYAILRRLAACHRFGLVHHSLGEIRPPGRHLFMTSG